MSESTSLGAVSRLQESVERMPAKIADLRNARPALGSAFVACLAGTQPTALTRLVPRLVPRLVQRLRGDVDEMRRDRP